MRSRRLLWMCAGLALALYGCAGATRSNPFKIPQAEIKGKVKIVALAPINFPTDIDDPDPVKAKFESLITAKLKEGGFTVVPSSEYGALWKQMTEQLGGFFDPMTGKRDEQKFKTVREHTLRELSAKTKADAVLGSAILGFKAAFRLNRASWHGTSEDLVPGGVLTAVLIGGHNGTVGALSLGVGLSDIHDVDLYMNYGGIQLLSKISRGNFSPVPRAELFADEERNRKAVDIALDPLLGKAVPTEEADAAKEKSY
ncbi:MAG TPA: hypothetical protein VGA73_15105 [Candidatus Binatia bacterium]